MKLCIDVIGIIISYMDDGKLINSIIRSDKSIIDYYRNIIVKNVSFICYNEIKIPLNYVYDLDLRGMFEILNDTMVKSTILLCKNVKLLNISCCRKLTDKAFENLKGIHVLNISNCDQSMITDKAFDSLNGIHILNMSYCNKTTITDKAFENLKGIHTLYMSGYYSGKITDKAFENLKGIHTLDMS